MSTGGRLALENTIKYFLIQRWASIVFLLGYFFSAALFKNLIYMSLISILLKLGAAPLHGWFISILKTCSIWVLIILSTLQKLIPLLIIRNFFLLGGAIYMSMGLRFIVIFFRLPGALRLNKILALSSLRNLIWFFSRLWANLKLLRIFIIIYFLLLVGVRFRYSSHACGAFNQLSTVPPLEKILIVFVLMSLGGLPPLLGFLGKLIVLKNIIYFMDFMFIIILLYTALIILYHYMSRIFFSLSYPPIVKAGLKRNYYNVKKFFYLASLATFNVLMLVLI